MKSKRIFLGLLLVLFIMALLPVSILAASTATQKNNHAAGKPGRLGFRYE